VQIVDDFRRNYLCLKRSVHWHHISDYPCDVLAPFTGSPSLSICPNCRVLCSSCCALWVQFNVCRNMELWPCIKVCRFVWVWNLVSHIKRRTYTEYVQELGTEENIGSYKGCFDRTLHSMYSPSPNNSLRIRKSSRVRLVGHAAGMEPLKMHAKCCQITWSVGLHRSQSQ